MKDNYIKATTDMLLAGTTPAEVFKGLVVILKKRGHERLLNSIAAGVIRNLEAQRPQGQATLTVASESTVSALKADIEAALEAIGATDKPVVAVDETIIGGFIAATDNQSVDASYKRRLVTLYRKVTN